MRFLGHKNIKNALRYVHLANSDREEYSVKATESIEGDKARIESGFEYVTELDGVKFFRKRK